MGATQQELAYPKFVRDRGEGSDVKLKQVPKLEIVKVQEGGMLSIKHTHCGVSVLCNIIFLI